MAETILINPRRKRKRRKHAAKKAALVNPRRKRKKRIRLRRNPVHRARIELNQVLASAVGGTLQGLTERVLTMIKKSDGTPMLPSPMRSIAFPLIAFAASNAIPHGEEVTLGAVGAASNQIIIDLLKKVLPSSIKSKIGLEGVEIPDIAALTEEDIAYLNRMIPYLIAYKDELQRYDEVSRGGQLRPIGQPIILPIGQNKSQTLGDLEILESIASKIKS